VTIRDRACLGSYANFYKCLYSWGSGVSIEDTRCSRLLLRELVLYVVSRFPRGVGRTRLMKLLFLIDAMSLKELGKRVTGIDWCRWRYGPFSKDVLDALDELVEKDMLAVDSGPEVRYVALSEPPKIPMDVKRVVDRVIEEYGFLPLKELLRKVYSEFNIESVRMGDRIIFDWRSEIVELAERSASDDDALVELLGRLCDAYRDALEALPRDALAMYAIAAKYLARRNPDRLRRLTENLVDVLESVREAIERDPRASIPPELRRGMLKVYRELLAAAVEAVRG